ncbi:hypothetical protein BDK51DRAFT_29170 [Blyttiomyces helicus]|uniref:Uncharacterized protein n=1 Tax=Blyttiomyces helicus TaxID=388810 RepID=A0A4P9WDG0_9FUNG|nr:hypothetical protein BDK51DRAFT_29170 [Blyttiomyces helicus]|eukprot:RKO89755.1 hypothetical protein BDK51DRAFT_29170 [Blyttiomyces helicus]
MQMRPLQLALLSAPLRPLFPPYVSSIHPIQSVVSEDEVSSGDDRLQDERFRRREEARKQDSSARNSPDDRRKYPVREYNGSLSASTYVTGQPDRSSPSSDIQDRRESQNELGGDIRGGSYSHQYQERREVESSSSDQARDRETWGKLQSRSRSMSISMSMSISTSTSRSGSRSRSRSGARRRSRWARRRSRSGSKTRSRSRSISRSSIRSHSASRSTRNPTSPERYENRDRAYQTNSAAGPSSSRFKDDRRDAGSSMSNRGVYSNTPSSDRSASPPRPRYPGREISPPHYYNWKSTSTVYGRTHPSPPRENRNSHNYRISASSSRSSAVHRSGPYHRASTPPVSDQSSSDGSSTESSPGGPIAARLGPVVEPPPPDFLPGTIATRLRSLFSDFLYMPLERISTLHKNVFNFPPWPPTSTKFLERLREVAEAAPLKITVHTFVIKGDRQIAYLAVPNRLRRAALVQNPVARLHALVPAGQRVQHSVLCVMYRRVYEPEDPPEIEDGRPIAVDAGEVRDFIESLRHVHRDCCEFGTQDVRVGGDQPEGRPTYRQAMQQRSNHQLRRQQQRPHRQEHSYHDRDRVYVRDGHGDEQEDDEGDQPSYGDAGPPAEPRVPNLTAAEAWLDATFGPAHLFLHSPARAAPSMLIGAATSMVQ